MYLLGVGMFEMMEQDKAIIGHTHPRHRDRVRTLLAGPGFIHPEFGRCLFVCLKCDTLHSRFYIKIERDFSTVYETRFRCGKCRSSLIEVGDDLDITKYRCKHCGKQTLEQYMGLMWD